MTSRQFTWHAKRGHGECLVYVENNNPNQYKQEIKKILLNNYAFLSFDEYRSAYACELAMHCNDDAFFINALWKKLISTDLNKDFLFEYLVNNLYFFLSRTKEATYERKLAFFITRCLKQRVVTLEQNNSICALISLVCDLKIPIDIKDIVNSHFKTHKDSNLELSNIVFLYPNLNGLLLVRNSQVHQQTRANNFEEFLDEILNNGVFNKSLPHYSFNLNQKQLDLMMGELHDEKTPVTKKTRILETIFHSSKCNFTYAKELLKLLPATEKKHKALINDILCNISSKKITSLLEYKNIDESTFVRISLKFYDPKQYDEIHKKFANCI